MPAPKRRSPRFLITRLSAIGDCILTMPVAAELRRTYPDSLIAWVVQGAGAQLLVDHPDLDQVIKVPRGWLKSPRAIWKLRHQLRQYSFDYVIDPQSLTKSSAAGWLSGASRRIGFSEPQGRELAPLLANHHVRRTADHVVDAYLQLLKPLGIHHPQVRFHVPRSSEATKMVDTFLDQVQPGPEFIVINPGAGWDSKLWPARRYGLLARELGRQHGIHSIVAWAGDRERSWTAEIVEQSAAYETADRHGRSGSGKSRYKFRETIGNGEIQWIGISSFMSKQSLFSLQFPLQLEDADALAQRGNLGFSYVHVGDQPKIMFANSGLLIFEGELQAVLGQTQCIVSQRELEIGSSGFLSGPSSCFHVIGTRVQNA